MKFIFDPSTAPPPADFLEMRRYPVSVSLPMSYFPILQNEAARQGLPFTAFVAGAIHRHINNLDALLPAIRDLRSINARSVTRAYSLQILGDAMALLNEVRAELKAHGYPAAFTSPRLVAGAVLLEMERLGLKENPNV